jgi:hypothetical protein
LRKIETDPAEMRMRDRQGGWHHALRRTNIGERLVMAPAKPRGDRPGRTRADSAH